MIVTLVVDIQPLASVIVTVYPAAVNPLILLVSALVTVLAPLLQL